MPLYFVAFLLMLAAFLLITIAAVARALWRRWRPIRTSHVAFERPPLKSSASDLLLLLGVAMAWYNVSSGWIAQLTIYPMYADMSAYGPQAFHGFGRGYLTRLPIIILPAGVMCLAWALLLWLPCRNVPKRIVWTIVAFWASSAGAGVPTETGKRRQKGRKKRAAKGDRRIFHDIARPRQRLKIMPRRARVIVPGVAHHVTQRGNHRQQVFYFG
jgi:hypothetical protein